MALPFRHTAGFGKRIEHWIVGQMLKEGLDVYLPLVDDDGIDGIIRREDGSFTEFQVKSRSKNVILGDAALFAALVHDLRSNYWFIFYSERLEKMWIMTSDEFVREAYQNKKGKHIGKRSVWFNGTKKNKETGERIENVKPQWDKYLATNFQRLKQIKRPPARSSSTLRPSGHNSLSA